MKRLFCCTILCFGLLTLQAQADTLGLTLNDFSAQLEYRHYLQEDSLGRAALHARLLYNDDEETRLGSVAFELIGEPGNVPGLEAAAVLQLYAGDTEPNQDLIALALGARGEYFPPMLGGFGVFAKAFYAPKILAFIDAERLFEAGTGVGYAFTPRVRLLVEYNALRAAFEKTDTWTIDEGVRVGFQARF